MTNSDYQKVSPRGATLLRRQKIWKGSDHLLVVTATGYTEEFKRFYFSDIQSLTILWSKAYVLKSVLFAMASLVAFAITLSNSGGFSGSVFIWTGIFVTLWIIHMVRGATCKCWVDTGINHEHLFALSRVSQAERFWTQVEPELTAAQGEFSMEEMDRLGAVVNRRTHSTPPTPPLVPNEPNINESTDVVADES